MSAEGFDVRPDELYAGAARMRTAAEEVTATGSAAASAVGAAGAACGGGPLAPASNRLQARMESASGQLGSALDESAQAVHACADTYLEVDAAAAEALDSVLVPGQGSG